MLHLGDITKISGYTAPIVDVVVGGSPCQDLSVADDIIEKQKNYINELEQQVDDLQKALDVVLQNKCRVRKAKVKIYGRTPNVCKNHNR